MTATYCCISAVHRVPVELWREILGFTLGPLLSNPEQDSLAEYKMLFRYYSSRPGLYVHKERIRASLMLVCKLWKDIVSDMDDKIMLVGGPDGYEPDWPPQKKRHEAKYIRYLDGRPEQYVSFQFPWSGAPFRTASVRGPKTFKINSEKPLAPVTLIERMNITVSDPVDGPLTTFTRNVRALHLQMSTNRYIDIFRVDILDNLTYLGLCDSGHGQSFKSFVQQAWSFPALRALVLQASDIHLPENAMKKWRCPSLTMFKYMFRRVY